MTIRITGMNSGLDTEAIITELASARSVKVQNIEKDKTKLSWKIDAWKELNAKIYDFYSEVLSDMRFDYAYTKKKTTVSDSSVVTIQTAGDAMNGVQTLKVNKLAQTGYLTGGKINASSGEKLLANLDGLDWLKDEKKSVTFKVTVGGEEKEIKLTGYNTINDVVEKFKEVGLDAKFDTSNGRFFIASKETGKAANFTISSSIQKELGVPKGLQKVPELWKVDTDHPNKDEVDAHNAQRDKIIEDNNKIIADNQELCKKLGLKEVPPEWDASNPVGSEDEYNKNRDAIIEANNKIIATEENIKASNAESSKNFVDTMGALGLLTADMVPQYGVLANMSDAAWMQDKNKSATFNVMVGGEKKEISLNGYDTLNDVIKKFKEIGLDAKYDESTKSLVVTSKTGAEVTMEPLTQGELGNGILDKLKKVPELEVIDAADSEEEKKRKTAANEARQKIIDDNNAIIKADEAAYEAVGIKALSGTESDADRDAIIANNNKIIADNNSIKAANAEATKRFTDTMKTLGMLTEEMAEKYGVEVTGEDTATDRYATMIEGVDAEIELNGAKFTSSKNVFEINGLTMTVHKTTTDPVTLTTEQDTDGIYDTIKNFFVKYNELINEMDKLYNAESASKYEPLTKEEKEALSDTEVEEWEKKIKESLLRRDGTLSSVSSAMKEVMLSTFIPDTNGRNEGKDKYLSYFGIETLGYFKAKDNEKSAYHIDGNADDSSVKNNADKLKKAIANEPDTVIEFFKKLSNNLYDKLTEKMERSDYSSPFTVYNDKQMDIELKSYDSKIKTEQDKLNDYIDRWYEKFSQMEVALSKLNSKESSLSSLFG